MSEIHKKDIPESSTKNPSDSDEDETPEAECKSFVLEGQPARQLKLALDSLSDPVLNGDGNARIDVNEDGLEITVKDKENARNCMGHLLLLAKAEEINFRFFKPVEGKIVPLDDIFLNFEDARDDDPFTISHDHVSNELLYMFGKPDSAFSVELSDNTHGTPKSACPHCYSEVAVTSDKVKEMSTKNPSAIDEDVSLMPKGRFCKKCKGKSVLDEPSTGSHDHGSKKFSSASGNPNSTKAFSVELSDNTDLPTGDNVDITQWVREFVPNLLEYPVTIEILDQFVTINLGSILVLKCTNRKVAELVGGQALLKWPSCHALLTSNLARLFKLSITREQAILFKHKVDLWFRRADSFYSSIPQRDPAIEPQASISRIDEQYEFVNLMHEINLLINNENYDTIMMELLLIYKPGFLVRLGENKYWEAGLTGTRKGVRRGIEEIGLQKLEMWNAGLRKVHELQNWCRNKIWPKADSPQTEDKEDEGFVVIDPRRQVKALLESRNFYGAYKELKGLMRAEGKLEEEEELVVVCERIAEEATYRGVMKLTTALWQFLPFSHLASFLKKK